MLHSTISRKGGQARSQARTAANRAKAAAFWDDVRGGKRAAPVRPHVPPSLPEVARKLETYCRANGIKRLEVFGSVARGEARRGSDVDLIATFEHTPGLRFFRMADDMADLVGAPVDLLSREEVDEMTNPFRKRSILADAREILRL